MEEEMQDRLENIYNFPVDVKFIDFRKYEIYGKVQKEPFCIPILYDGKATLETNIHNTVAKIDSEILKIFKKGN